MACVSSISLDGSQSLWNLLAAVHGHLVADRPTSRPTVGPNSPRGWNSKTGNLVCRYVIRRAIEIGRALHDYRFRGAPEALRRNDAQVLNRPRSH